MANINPLFSDYGGINSGSTLNGVNLNMLAVAQSYVMNVTTPTGVGGTSITYTTAPQIAVNTGTLATSGYFLMTNLTLTGLSAASRDYYVYGSSATTYYTDNVATGTPYTVNTLNGALLCKVTTGASTITAITTSVAVTSPFPTTGMNLTGTNAGAVAFPSSLSVGSTLGVTGATTLSSTLGVTGVTTLGSNIYATNATQALSFNNVAAGLTVTAFSGTTPNATRGSYTMAFSSGTILAGGSASLFQLDFSPGYTVTPTAVISGYVSNSGSGVVAPLQIAAVSSSQLFITAFNMSSSSLALNNGIFTYIMLG